MWVNFKPEGKLSFKKIEYNTTSFDSDKFKVDGSDPDKELSYYLKEIAQLCGLDNIQIGNATFDLNKNHYFLIEHDGKKLSFTLGRKSILITLKIKFIRDGSKTIKIKNGDDVIYKSSGINSAFNFSDIEGGNISFKNFNISEVGIESSSPYYQFKNDLLNKILYPNTEWREFQINNIITTPQNQNPSSLSEDISYENFLTPYFWLNNLGGVVNIPFYYIQDGKKHNQLSTFSTASARMDQTTEPLEDGQFYVQDFRIYNKSTNTALNWTVGEYYPILLYEDDLYKDNQQCSVEINSSTITLTYEGQIKTISWNKGVDKLLVYTRIASSTCTVEDPIKPEFFSFSSEKSTRPNYIDSNYGKTSTINLSTDGVYDIAVGSTSTVSINDISTTVKGTIEPPALKIFDYSNSSSFSTTSYLDEYNEDIESWTSITSGDLYDNFYSKIIGEKKKTSTFILKNVGDWHQEIGVKAAIGSATYWPSIKNPAQRLNNGIFLQLEVAIPCLTLSEPEYKFNNKETSGKVKEANDVDCYCLCTPGSPRKIYTRLSGRVQSPNGIFDKYIPLIKEPEKDDSVFTTGKGETRRGFGTPFTGETSLEDTSYSYNRNSHIGSKTSTYDWGWQTEGSYPERFLIKCGINFISEPLHNWIVLWKKVV